MADASFSKDSDPNLAADKAKAAESPAWVNAAFVVEALVILAVIVAAMAVFSSLFTSAIVSSKNAERLTQAIQVASNAAEEFAQDPEAIAQGQTVGLGYAKDGSQQGDLTVHVSVESDDVQSGTLYTAHISVTEQASGSDAQAQASEVYALDSSRYVREAE